MLIQSPPARQSKLHRSAESSSTLSLARGEATVRQVKPIEDVSVGDLVWAWDDARGALAPRKVVRLFRRKAKPVLDVVLACGDVEQRITATTEHPFWVEGKGWVPAQELQPGDSVKRIDGEPGMSVLRVVDAGAKADVFNFEVEGVHNYFVGHDGVLVHNSSVDPSSDTLRPSFFREEPFIAEAAPFSEPGEAGGLFDLLPNNTRRPLDRLRDMRSLSQGSRFAGNLLDAHQAFQEGARVLDERLGAPTRRSAELPSGTGSSGRLPIPIFDGPNGFGAMDPLAGEPGFGPRGRVDGPPTIRSPWDPVAHASDGMGRRFDVVDSGSREGRIKSLLETIEPELQAAAADPRRAETFEREGSWRPSVYDAGSRDPLSSALHSGGVIVNPGSSIGRGADLILRNPNLPAPIGPRGFAALAGLENGARMTLMGAQSRNLTTVRIEGYHSLYGNDATVRKIVDLKIDSHGVSMDLDYTQYVKDYRGLGLGTSSLYTMAAAGAEIGANRIGLYAMGGSHNGPYTWAVLGFDARLKPDVRKMLSGTPAHGAATVHDIISNPKAREYWRNHQIGMGMDFDLTAGSRSWQTLLFYIMSRS